MIQFRISVITDRQNEIYSESMLVDGPRELSCEGSRAVLVLSTEEIIFKLIQNYEQVSADAFRPNSQFFSERAGG